MTTTATTLTTRRTAAVSAALADARADRLPDADRNAHHPTSHTRATGASPTQTHTAPAAPTTGPAPPTEPEPSNTPRPESGLSVAARPNPTHQLTRPPTRTPGQAHLIIAAA